MSPSQSGWVVVAVASFAGTMLATAARALTDGPAPAAAPPSGLASGSGASSSGGPSPAAASGVPHDDVDPDDSHPSDSDNPYDESPAPAHAAIARQPVVLQDGMFHLPGGRFVMGSRNPHAPANEHPALALTLAPFWIDRTEVTVGAYKDCVEAGRCPRPARASATCTYEAGDPELPVSCVHWRDADAYCRFAGKRLPSEMEWEYAARGNLAVVFPWGKTPSCSNAVTLLNEQSGLSCAKRPARVGAHPAGASVFGLLDMSGNVEEWTSDWYAESLGPAAAPRAGAAYVLRGGGWLSPPSMSRTTSRNWGSALEAGPNVGFRCAKD
jgi:formylglycine-generating enzyme required for sulfatase activity